MTRPVIQTTKEQILEFWKGYANRILNSANINAGKRLGIAEFLDFLYLAWQGEYTCFGCKLISDDDENNILQRAHIVSYALGGKDVPQNYVLLCPACHEDSPNTKFPRIMFRWLRNRPHQKREEIKLVCEGCGITEETLHKLVLLCMDNKKFDKYSMANSSSHYNKFTWNTEVPLMMEFAKSEGVL